jgi:uncharacterized protein YdcH (DUF465 family)
LSWKQEQAYKNFKDEMHSLSRKDQHFKAKILSEVDNQINAISVIRQLYNVHCE